jgi:hypothetical protein
MTICKDQNRGGGAVIPVVISLLARSVIVADGAIALMRTLRDGWTTARERVIELDSESETVGKGGALLLILSCPITVFVSALAHLLRSFDVIACPLSTVVFAPHVNET